MQADHRDSSDVLDLVLHEGGYAQNRRRQDVSPCLHEWHQNRLATSPTVCGQTVHSLNHLGGVIDPFGSDDSEVDARVKALKRGWGQFTGFWGARGIPWLVKRVCVICRPQSHAVSALQSCTLTTGETHQLDKHLLTRLRNLDGSNRGLLTTRGHARPDGPTSEF